MIATSAACYLNHISRWCQTASVSFHESFWVAIGAAAPVIALAAIVAFTDTGRTWADWLRDQRDKNDEDIKQGYVMLWTGSVAGLVNVLLQVVTLVLALLSLAASHDRVPLIVAEIMAPLGIFLLLVNGIVIILIRST